MDWDHSVIFEVAPRTAFQAHLLIMRATSFLLWDSCPQEKIQWLSELNSPIPTHFSLLIPKMWCLLLPSPAWWWRFSPKSCLTLATPWIIDCPIPLSTGISQARVLEWIAMSFSRGPSWPSNWTSVSCISGRRFNAEPTESPDHVQFTWIMDLIVQVPMQYLLFFAASDFTFISRHIYTWGSFPLGPSHVLLSGATTNSSRPLLFPSSILDIFWPGEFIFPCRIFLFFLYSSWFSWQVYRCGLPFPSPVGQVLLELFSMTCPSWVALHHMDQAPLPWQGSNPWRGNQLYFNKN